MKLVETFADARRAGSGMVGLVPTMGYLHEGHLSLLQGARGECDTLIMSLFVNPLQFGPGEDLDTYPRDLERDAELADEAGVDVLFAPQLSAMYPVEPVTRVSVDALARSLDGRARPSHFTGVATVVTKLLAGIRPDRAYFGRKDAQQLAIVERMVLDLSFPTAVVGLPIVREPDGLALSSRNIFLDPAERVAASALSRGVMAAADAVEMGERSGRVLEALAMEEMRVEPAVQPEYAELVARRTIDRLQTLDRPAVLAVAARVGRTRLIDNVHFDVVGGSFIPDRGLYLERRSLLYRRQ